MKLRLSSMTLMAASTVALAAGTSTAGTRHIPENIPHRFIALPNNAPGHRAPLRRAGAALSQLPQWDGGFTDLTGAAIHFTMAGPDPHTSNATTTFPVVIVPVKLQYSASYNNAAFDPTTHIVAGTHSNVIQMIEGSPIFKANIKFVQGGVNLGKTQYIDAFQRGNFWSAVKTNSDYHVLLGSPTLLKTLTINVADDPRPNGDGVYHFTSDGSPVAVLDISEFDAALQSYMGNHAAEITPGVLPIFVTYQTYLIENHNINLGVIGGYHSANGAQPSGQTYSYATYVDSRPHFAQDVEALSHEIGEWLDDPFVDNLVNCRDNTGGYLEVGDPLEGDVNWGGYPYSVAGYTYNLQSLVYMPYWGAPANTSVNGWFTFQGSPAQNPNSHDSITGVCPGQ